MEPKEKNISYTTTNTYLCLNELNSSTKNVWIVLHGIGFLSKYFLKYFKGLPKEENYIIAPQAPSKYYLKSNYKHVGASWLTKENTEMETENVIRYLDQVLLNENIPEDCRLIVLGFSQGVSIATRWVAKSKIPCKELILYAGGVPAELTPSDFEFLMSMNPEVKIVLGKQDEYLTPQRLQKERPKIDALFQGRAKYILFEGGHEVNMNVINKLIE
ncbi:2-succinyl-6-hydroxy-2,4-cyclohexadiene-1-carboxylate synthase [Arenibacter antarcticus]|uniref:Alpha/beta hydrolase n=1 Tax=Arenibacter antarcticus TaxID=2040469 RepID=A0ABW5VH42_9FLAO|nr:esterase [Arenibacter sp. H213]MCM4168203.1 esterase [Arenibacter sp. H213]